jgi:hypothetical protein
MANWMDTRRADFGKATPAPIAEPLFAAPDRFGTPDLLTAYEEPKTMTTTDQAAPWPPAPPAPDDHDARFTHGLMHDVVKVLEAHGYKMPAGAPAAHARSLLALGDLVRVFEGGEL